MEPEKRKTWTKPQLTVLLRSKPDESVLLACKGFSPPPGPGGGPCAACVNAAPS